MAPESFYGKFTVKTDVWAYGVTCWEIFMLARVQPYCDMFDKEIIEKAVCREGPKLLKQPNCCNDATFQLMKQCWNLIPEERPTFTDLCTQLRR
jgi:serine/threonine protein kinase